MLFFRNVKTCSCCTSKTTHTIPAEATAVEIAVLNSWTVCFAWWMQTQIAQSDPVQSWLDSWTQKVMDTKSTNNIPMLKSRAMTRCFFRCTFLISSSVNFVEIEIENHFQFCWLLYHFHLNCQVSKITFYISFIFRISQKSSGFSRHLGRSGAFSLWPVLSVT